MNWISKTVGDVDSLVKQLQKDGVDVKAMAVEQAEAALMEGEVIIVEEGKETTAGTEVGELLEAVKKAEKEEEEKKVEEGEIGMKVKIEGNMKMISKREAKLKAVWEAEQMEIDQKIRRKIGNWEQFGETAGKQLEKNILKSNRRDVFLKNPLSSTDNTEQIDPLQMIYEYKNNEDGFEVTRKKKYDQTLRIVEGSSDEEYEENQTNMKIVES